MHSSPPLIMGVSSSVSVSSSPSLINYTSGLPHRCHYECDDFFLRKCCDSHVGTFIFRKLSRCSFALSHKHPYNDDKLYCLSTDTSPFTMDCVCPSSSLAQSRQTLTHPHHDVIPSIASLTFDPPYIFSSCTAYSLSYTVVSAAHCLHLQMII
jgi:hypothetical protein